MIGQGLMNIEQTKFSNHTTCLWKDKDAGGKIKMLAEEIDDKISIQIIMLLLIVDDGQFAYHYE